jgi:hypothetical protein
VRIRSRNSQQRIDCETEVHSIAVAARARLRVDLETAVSLLEQPRISGRRTRSVGDLGAPWITELEVALTKIVDRVARLVHKAVVARAE